MPHFLEAKSLFAYFIEEGFFIIIGTQENLILLVPGGQLLI